MVEPTRLSWFGTVVHGFTPEAVVLAALRARGIETEEVVEA